MAATKPVRLSSEAAHRIRVAAWGFPADMKLSDLQRELQRAIFVYNFLRSLGAEAKAQLVRLKKIHEHASALANVLAADEESEGIFAKQLCPEDMPTAIKLTNKMREIVEESGLLETSPQSLADESRAQYAASDDSPFEWLVGKRLPQVFKWFFREDATLYRKGRYLDFALQVLTEFEITNNGRPYSRETLIRALTRARRGHGRRRHGGQS